VTIPPTIADKLRAHGDGSLSQGIIRAAKRVRVAPDSGDGSKKMLSNAQRRALKWGRDGSPLRDGTIEQSIDLELTGAALEKVIAALERKGYLAGEFARITPAGLAALAEAEAARKACHE
jgi:hypothetical protein